MSKFNPTSTNKTTNLCGHIAYKMDNKSKLMTQVLTSFFNEPKYYGDNSAELVKTAIAVIRKDPAFVAKLAVFARREFNMRSVAHVLTALLAYAEEGKPYVRSTVRGVSLRGDDITEIMAFYLTVFEKPIPNALKKGINDVLSGLSEYELAKYKGEKKGVKMRDLIILCHPAPKDEAQADLWKRCIEGKLKTPETWETQLSAHGNKKSSWERLIDDNVIGYMAALRNLRNVLQENPDNLDKFLARLEDPAAVRKSKQLPFRFLSAYRAVRGVASSRVYDVLENAVDASVENLPRIPGKTVIAVDVSGSMCAYISRKSDVQCIEIGLLLGLIANRICADSIFYTFDTMIEKHPLSTRTAILSTAMNHRHRGGGTDMELPLQEMIGNRIKADRLIILSDNMCNYGRETVQTLADEYRRKINPEFWVHAIDLIGYGTQQFCGPKTNLITGWSEKILQFILLMEEGEDSLMKRIENYEPNHRQIS